MVLGNSPLFELPDEISLRLPPCVFRFLDILLCLVPEIDVWVLLVLLAEQGVLLNCNRLLLAQIFRLLLVDLLGLKKLLEELVTFLYSFLVLALDDAGDIVDDRGVPLELIHVVVDIPLLLILVELVVQLDRYFPVPLLQLLLGFGR